MEEKESNREGVRQLGWLAVVVQNKHSEDEIDGPDSHGYAEGGSFPHANAPLEWTTFGESAETGSCSIAETSKRVFFCGLPSRSSGNEKL